MRRRLPPREPPARPPPRRMGLVDLRPPTDDRPFFNRFVRWAQLAAYQRATGGRLYGLLLSGDVVALAVLAEALVMALVLLAIPWLRAGGPHGAGAFGRGRRDGTVPAGAVVAYNLAVGLGFILLELMLIQRLTVALGDPVVSFKVVRRAAGVVGRRRPAVGTSGAVTDLAGGGRGGRRRPRLRWRRVRRPAVAAGTGARAAGGGHRRVAGAPGRGPRHGVPVGPAPAGAPPPPPAPWPGPPTVALRWSARSPAPCWPWRKASPPWAW